MHIGAKVPHTRTIGFRLTEEEYAQLVAAAADCADSGVASPNAPRSFAATFATMIPARVDPLTGPVPAAS